MAPLLKAIGLSKSFGTLPVVRRISLEVKPGKIVGLAGQSGSGKSTLIRVISTLLLADNGETRVFGLDNVSDEMAVKRLISRVSVDAAFFK